MKRAIIVPAAPTPEALAELKQWLAIASSRDDPGLARLIGTSLDMFEDFTGRIPLEATFEEVLPAGGAWQRLSSRPVTAVLGVEAVEAVETVGAAGARSRLPAEAAMIELTADESATVRVLHPVASGRIAVRFVAGLASGWSELPEGLRHGLIRCAAHLHQAAAGSGEQLPAAVAALWRPWRRMRLS